jgi:hypothetical protein
MINFSKYITESANAKTTLEGLKKYLPLVSDKYKTHVEQHIAVLIKAAEEKTIYNARYGESSKAILNFVDKVYRVLEKTIIDYRQNNRDASEKLPYSLYNTSDIKKAIKDATKISDLPSHIKSFFDSIKDIPELLNIIKSYVQKGREPKPVDPSKPAAFVKPSASFDSSKTATKFMKEAAESFEKELHENITKQVMSSYEKVKEYNGKSPLEIPKDPSLRSIASTVFKTTTKAGKQILEFIPGHENRLKKLIDNNVRDIVDGFVGKSSLKLALILQKKGMPNSHDITRTNVRNGMVENSMKFVFEDGSSFTLESSVVYKYSQMGKLFFQYPTRFKNVRLADGTPMKMPSEEKMIKEF